MKVHEDLFWAKVKKTATCWFWLGSKNNGYGRLNHGKKSYAAHRVSYELANGPVPDGLQIDHMCMIRSCVNPDHLRAISVSENLKTRNMTAPKNKYRTKTKKVFLLYIHHPSFKSEEGKSELVNKLLNQYYNTRSPAKAGDAKTEGA